MPHRKGHLTLSLIAEVYELGLFVTHAVDHLLPGSTHHEHRWEVKGEPEQYGLNVLVVEGCDCGALRYDRLAFDGDAMRFRRMACTTIGG